MTVVPELMKQFGYKSVMEVPRIEKITLNMGVGEAVADKKVLGFRGGRHAKDCRPKAGRDQVKEIHCRFQDSRWLSDRLQGHAA